jgi:hypothetical protein
LSLPTLADVPGERSDARIQLPDLGAHLLGEERHLLV